MEIIARVLCLCAGYAAGNFLTAQIVARKFTGKDPKEIGSGNPGMANMMSHVGKKAGFLVLAGDLGKTFLVIGVCYLLAHSVIGMNAVLYAGMGAVLGHNYPVWKKFKGGKGVAVTCAFLTCYLGIFGVLCCLIGGLTVLACGYLPVGAMMISLLAIPCTIWIRGMEGGIWMVVSALIMISRHWCGLQGMKNGAEKRVFFGRK